MASSNPQCFGELDHRGNPACDGDDVQTVEVTVWQDASPFTTRWCKSCREAAVAGALAVFLSMFSGRAKLATDHCQCENKCHFPGSEGHTYGAIHPVRPVRTIYGTFNVCQTCASTCMMESAVNV